ncbi:hypothetical protein [Polaromonas sp. SM01]|uniref:hypothetical protein n=1 Tax=Polaromonas sp. SM01 TaxID=3085630 RepID=UPI002981193E|nr:hypothetical protein [Polaromonas sp. SM01]MDW5441071.1 hypothetical protein [Polaromonas sp. SM01]
MDNMIVYIDEAAYALKMLTPMLPSGEARTPTRWIVVGCAPRITHHVSKWVTNSARQSWRGKWAEKVFAQIIPLLQGPGDSVITQVARGPLCDLTDALITQYGVARVLDARRPKLGQDLPPVTHQQPQEAQGVWGYAAVVAGAGVLLAAD